MPALQSPHVRASGSLDPAAFTLPLPALIDIHWCLVLAPHTLALCEAVAQHRFPHLMRLSLAILVPDNETYNTLDRLLADAGFRPDPGGGGYAPDLHLWVRKKAEGEP